MKKTITMLLLTALCITVLTSCDVGNGLVAELIGDLKEQGNHVIVEPSVGLEESEIVAIDPIEPWGTVEVETTPPVEYPVTDPAPETQEPQTTQDHGSDVEVPKLMGYGYLYVEGVYKTDGSREPETEILLDEEQLEDWDGFVHIDESLECIRIVGYAGYNRSDDMNFYYWLNISTKKHFEYVTTFEPDAATLDKIKEMGADYPVGFIVTVPTEMLEPGLNGVTLLADPIGALIDGWVFFDDFEIEMFTTVPETEEVPVEDPIID
ncbi:MAG: hypothetical protein IJF08_08250 [Clostridia bacterium]|nr:hypothetical protein [Clostridia bacterium]